MYLPAYVNLMKDLRTASTPEHAQGIIGQHTEYARTEAIAYCKRMLVLLEMGKGKERQKKQPETESETKGASLF